MVHNLVTIIHRGRRHAGEWTVAGRLLTVALPGYGRKTTQLGASPPATLARIMLRELADDDQPFRAP